MTIFTKMRMDGEVVLITGATRGIGRSVAREVATTGATLIVIGRSHARTAALVSELHNIGGSGPIHGEVCDLTLQSEIRALADRILAEHVRLDVLINNAGAIFSQRQFTSEGFERTWALNHNAYFLLTALLRNVLVESSPARIINVASDAHYVGSMCWDDLQLARNQYWWGWRAYSQSKLANVLFTRQLAYFLTGSKVTVNAVHPGFVNTGFHRNNGLLAKTMMVLSLPMQRQSGTGAETVVWAAISEAAKRITGEYLYDCKPRKASERAMDMAAASRLWEISVSMTAPQYSGD